MSSVDSRLCRGMSSVDSLLSRGISSVDSLLSRGISSVDSLLSRGIRDTLDVIQFVSDLLLVGGFLYVLRLLSAKSLSLLHVYIVESRFKHQ
jgi:hypothetical protein